MSYNNLTRILNKNLLVSGAIANGYTQHNILPILPGALLQVQNCGKVSLFSYLILLQRENLGRTIRREVVGDLRDLDVRAIAGKIDRGDIPSANPTQL